MVENSDPWLSCSPNGPLLCNPRGLSLINSEVPQWRKITESWPYVGPRRSLALLADFPGSQNLPHPVGHSASLGGRNPISNKIELNGQTIL